MSEDDRYNGSGAADGPAVSVVTLDDFERRSRSLREAADTEASVATASTAPGNAELGEVVEDDDVFASATPGGATPTRMPLSRQEPDDATKVDPRMRALARAIDVVIFALLAESISYLGPLAALLYILFADGLIDGASVGKRLARLRVVRGRDERPASLFDSLLRNAPLGIAGLFVLIPIIGWVLFLTLGFLIIFFEGYLVWRDPRGARAGDILAGTQVMDARKKRDGDKDQPA